MRLLLLYIYWTDWKPHLKCFLKENKIIFTLNMLNQPLSDSQTFPSINPKVKWCWKPWFGRLLSISIDSSFLVFSSFLDQPWWKLPGLTSDIRRGLVRLWRDISNEPMHCLEKIQGRELLHSNFSTAKGGASCCVNTMHFIRWTSFFTGKQFSTLPYLSRLTAEVQIYFFLLLSRLQTPALPKWYLYRPVWLGSDLKQQLSFPGGLKARVNPQTWCTSQNIAALYYIGYFFKMVCDRVFFLKK